MVIYEGTDGSKIRYIEVARGCTRRKRVTNYGSTPGKPNKTQSKVHNNTNTQSRDIGADNIRYIVESLILV
jgi:hypothetical protein